MGLEYGCTREGDKAFQDKYKLYYLSSDSTKQIIMRIDQRSHTFVVSTLPGDCTAASIEMENSLLEQIDKIFSILQEYLSINGRISCFFSKKVHEASIPDWLATFKKFPIAGLHIHKSNRNPDQDTYMITGILKVPNPIINDYSKWTHSAPYEHNHNDVTKLNDINQQFNLPTF